MPLPTTGTWTIVVWDPPSGPAIADRATDSERSSPLLREDQAHATPGDGQGVQGARTSLFLGHEAILP